MKKNLYTLFCLTAFIFLSGKVKSQIYINEISCANLSQFADNYGDYGDWFELYNAGASAVNLQGYYLSDDSLNNLKWQFPSTVNIAANGFIRIWASGRGLIVGNSIHTNFKLTQTKSNKEEVTLSDPSGNIVDQIKLTEKTQLGHSYGRTTNGAATWSVFTTPTLASSNNSATSYLRYAMRPDFDIAPGFYNSTQTVSITTTESAATIRYTTDGSLPTSASPIYTAPVSIASTKVLKAIVFTTTPGVLPSFIQFGTYFINEIHTVPVVSITGTNLTQLANGNGNLEPFGSFEYFDTLKQSQARTYGEFNQHGQDSWANSHRSLDFVSRDEMGYNAAIKERLFSMSTRDEFQRIILRAAGDDNYPADFSPQNAGSAHMRDAYIQNLAKSGKMNLDVREGAKCVVYLNGAYWGVYDLRENPDDHDFTKLHYGQDKFHLQYIKTWGNTWAQYGGTQALTDWTNFRNFIMNNNMADPANYKYVTDRLEVLSLIDYVIVNTFTVCTDWLNYNTGWWRGMDSTGTKLKWSYILWDNDATFDFYINYTGLPTTLYTANPCDPLGLTGNSDPKGHITMLNKLRTNPDFDQLFITREIDVWNTVFSCDNMLAQFDSTRNVIDPEMTRQTIKWGGTKAGWLTNTNTMRTFISNRCNHLGTNGFANCFGVTGPYDVTVTADPVNAGKIKFNTLELSQFPWQGKYYNGVATKLEAIADTNYVFNNWSSTNQVFSPAPTSSIATFSLTGNDSIIAHFTYSPTGIAMPSELGIGLYPMPSTFSNQTKLVFELPDNMAVSLRIYNLNGSQSINLISDNDKSMKGKYAVNVNFEKAQMAAGVYIAELVANGVRKTTKLIYAPQ